MFFGEVPSVKDFQGNFLEDDCEGKIDFDDALEEAMRELHIEDKKQLAKDEMLKKFVIAVQEKTKISLRELSLRLGINRERIRRQCQTLRPYDTMTL